MANWGLWGCSRALTWLFWTTTGNEVCFSVIMMGLSNLVASKMSISKLKLRGRCVFADHTKMQKSPFWCPTPSSLLGNLCVYHVFYHKHHNQLVCSQPCWWTLDSKERKKGFRRITRVHCCSVKQGSQKIVTFQDLGPAIMVDCGHLKRRWKTNHL